MSVPSELMLASPYDGPSVPPAPLVQLRVARRQAWVPSRYNARAAHGDGRLILWNTYTGALSIFPPAQRAAVEALLARRGFVGEPTGLAKYLADRGFLVSTAVDEFRRVRQLHGREQHRTDRLELILLASEDCNFRCTYCYEDFARGTMSPEVRAGVKALLDHRADSLSELTVTWFGGEPLYGWDAVADLAPHIQAYCREHDIRLANHMTTNGFLLTPDVAERLLAWDVRRFQITLDGHGADHDARRRGRDGSGTFARILENLKALHATRERFMVTLRMNFDRENHARLEPLLDCLAQELEHDRRFEIYPFPVERWGGANDADLAVCGLADGDDAYWRLMTAAKARGLRVGRGVTEYSPSSGVCYAARPYNFIVGASGKLMKCTVALDKEDYNVVGHLTTEGEVVVDPDKVSLWTDAAFEDDKVCRNCHVLPLCQGLLCPLERIQHGKRECMPVKRRLKRELVATLDTADTAAAARRAAAAAPAVP